MNFDKVIEKYRKISFSERDKGDRFERLIRAYLQTDPMYANLFKEVWLWNEFPSRKDFGGSDIGIDIVGLTYQGDYWAVQCKCYKQEATINKAAVDTFLSTSSRVFYDEQLIQRRFTNRLWVSTTNNWGQNATETIKNQTPPVTRLNLHDLREAPIDWEKLEHGISGEQSLLIARDLKPHQREALEKTHEYFKKKDRGKLIMACGTGKTFNSLRIAEKETRKGGLVLFLVPSIALMGQTLREWTSYAEHPIYPICICSDPDISKKKTKEEDGVLESVIDLALPASTNVKDIVKQFKIKKNNSNGGMTVVFSTYQSIDVISKAQKEIGRIFPDMGEFDLIICDEAHRTTGVRLSGEEESAFIKVHDNEFLKSKKRLYMTATPRLYSEDTKSKAAERDALLCSMDDESLYGEEIYRIGFGEAVEKDLLTDYKVLILTLSGEDYPPEMQKLLSGNEKEIKTDDISKLIGCINALSKQILGDEGIIKENDPDPMKRAVAFCQKIVVSKAISETFNAAADVYINSLPEEKKPGIVSTSSRHIDGTMSAPIRDEHLSWLKTEHDENECRILTNVRCLSEGVDVPSLDAVMFLSARNSQIDVVQSVGRVMRKAPGKKYGYIIIPVVIPVGISPEEALNDNERFKVVWTVLNALRAHDDRFNATINKIELNRKKPSNIIVGVIGGGGGKNGDRNGGEIDSKEISEQLYLQFENMQAVVYARLVQKVGDRQYWEQWAASVGEIAQRQSERISNMVKDGGHHEEEFAKFLQGLRNNINPAITSQEAIDMLAQHIITRPVFDALFEGYSFIENNPVSKSMQTMLELLEDRTIEEETEKLTKFYDSVRKRAEGIDNAEGRQKIIIELYDKFFRTAFPKMVEKLGIVYTPVEIVDYIIRSVDDVLKKEFNRSIGDDNVQILDPFTGTGTFVTRLIQSGLIPGEKIVNKYKNEIHANEIVLLAYYIAAINIENAYHDVTGETQYTPFGGICLTDTFQLGEDKDKEIKDKDRKIGIYMLPETGPDMFAQNSERAQKQKKAPIKVIIGNPPYSVGQKSANDNAQNQSYPQLDKKIANTYAKESTATNKNALYDSYIKAFRWSSDRIDKKHGGVIAFVTNAGWLDGKSMSGFRSCLEKEFTSIYVFNMRGNQRTSGELSRKEGGKIFGSGSRTPIAITLLIKNPNAKNEKAVIYYHDIGDYLNRQEKLEIVKKCRSAGNPSMKWEILNPNEHNDWLNKRNDLFDTFIPLAPEKKFDMKAKSFFIVYSCGIKSNRDAWVYNFSKNVVVGDMKKTIEFYNEQVNEYEKERKVNPVVRVKDFVDNNPKKISWTRALQNDVRRGIIHSFGQGKIYNAIYRPYTKQNLLFYKPFIEMTYQQLKFFPTVMTDNLVITVPGLGGTKEFSHLITDCVPDISLQDSGGQCFSLYYYEERDTEELLLPFHENEDEGGNYIRRDGISDFILERAVKQYGKRVTKEDIFYYVYGFLHNPQYRGKFDADLKKTLPRLPLLDNVQKFWDFSKAGRQLAEIHINYENIAPYDKVKITGIESGKFRVDKMRFAKKQIQEEDGKGNMTTKTIEDKSVIVYNNHITIENIPEEAYGYVINGRSAIEWIMERYRITIHKDSGIKNDPNDWAEEIGDERYILDLLLRIINLSLKTIEIVNALPDCSEVFS